MRVSRIKLRTIVTLLLAVSFFATGIIALAPQKALAAGETFMWTGVGSQITASGEVFNTKDVDGRSNFYGYLTTLRVNGVTENATTKSGTTVNFFLSSDGTWEGRDFLFLSGESENQLQHGIFCSIVFTLTLTTPGNGTTKGSGYISAITSESDFARAATLNGNFDSSTKQLQPQGNADVINRCNDVAREYSYPRRANFDNPITIEGTAPASVINNFASYTATYTWDGNNIVSTSPTSSPLTYTRTGSRTFAAKTFVVTPSTDPNSPDTENACLATYTITFNDDIKTGDAGSGTVKTTDCGLTVSAVVTISANRVIVHQNEECANHNGVLSWVICPMQGWLMDSATALDRIILEQITVDTEAIFYGSPYTSVSGGITTDEDELQQTSNAFRAAWVAFRTIAYALLVIIGLIMVVSQIIGLDIFDAYTIRKMLPKLVIVTIILPLLWPLLAFVFNMANDSAVAVQTIMISPFQGMSVQLDAVEGGMRGFVTGLSSIAVIGGIIIAGGVIAIAGAWGIVFMLILMAAISVLSAFFVLMTRDIVIYMLIVASPIALVCAVFEPFRKGFTIWRTYLVTILLSIPAIMAVLTAGKIAAGIAMVTNQNTGAILGLLFVVVSYFMFWSTFKKLDKLSGQISNSVNKVTALPQKLLRKTVGKKALNALGVAAQGKGTANGRFTRSVRMLVHGAANLRHIKGINPRNWEAQIRNQKAAELEAIRKAFEEDPELAAFRNDDALHRIAADTAPGDRKAVRRQLQALDRDGKRYGGLSARDKAKQMLADEEAILAAHHSLGMHSAAVLTTTLPSTASMDGEGPGESIRRIFEQSKGDLTLAAALWQGTKERATKAGRTDYGARQGAFLEAYAAYEAKLKELDGAVDDQGRPLTNEAKQKLAEQAAEEIIVDAAYDQQGPQAFVQGRHETSKAAAGYIIRKRKRTIQKLGEAQEALALATEKSRTVAAGGTVTGEDGRVISPETVQAELIKAQETHALAVKELEHTWADTEGIVDVVGYAAPEKGRDIAEGLGAKINLDSDEYAPLRIELEARYEQKYPGATARYRDYQRQHQEWEVNARDAAANGNPIPPEPRYVGPPPLDREFSERDLVKMVSDLNLDINGTIDTRRRQYGTQALADRARYGTEMPGAGLPPQRV